MLSRGPLAGIRVLDLSRILAGPYCSMILGDMGAEVIKIENPNHPDETRFIPPYINGQSHYYLSINRNKLAMTLNLKNEKGKRIFLELVKKSDVVLENFRPGTMDKMGLSYSVLKEVNPSIILCSISGFGQYGPLRDKVAFDIVVQAMSGVMSINGAPDSGPVRLGIPMGDLIGGLYGAIGILSAIHRRVVTREGAHIDISLSDGLVSLLGYLAGLTFVTGQSPGKVGNAHHNIVPYGVFETRDGHIIVACLTESFWDKLCTAIGKPEIANDPKFKNNIDRVKHRDEVDEIVSKALVRKTTSEWEQIFREYDIPHAPILNIKEVLTHEHFLARGMVNTVCHSEYGEVKIVGRPVQFAGEDGAFYTSPPLIGEHTEQILAELGYSETYISSLKKEGII